MVWALWGYSLAFAPSVGGFGFVGDLSAAGLNNIGPSTINSNYSTNIPEYLYFAFQLKFAAITPALIIGAFAERIKFRSLLIFAVLWSTIIYSPVARWVWGVGGWIFSLGALDFAGGMVVHTTAGLSALAAALVVGRRKDADHAKEFRPNNIPFVILGTALLWFGWFGFNAGSSLAANDIAVSALVVTNLSAAAAAVSWMLVDWKLKGKPSAVGISVGAVCGLAAITPAAGYVGVPAAIVIGLCAGVLSNLISNWRAGRTRLDDSLDVFACHGVGGIWGSIAIGLFASKTINPAGKDGLFFGNPQQILVQLIAVTAVALFAFVGSYAILKLVNFFAPLRVSPEEEERGLDESEFGEEAYSEQ